jgi:hypothetical protein
VPNSSHAHLQVVVEPLWGASQPLWTVHPAVQVVWHKKLKKSWSRVPTPLKTATFLELAVAVFYMMMFFVVMLYGKAIVICWFC